MAKFDQYGFNDDKTKYDLTQIDSVIDSKIETAKDEILRRIFPVGCVVFMWKAISPHAAGYPGSWQAVDDGFFIKTVTLGNAGKTYGAGAMQLTASHLPQHYHRLIPWPSTTQDEITTRDRTGNQTGCKTGRCRLIKGGTGQYGTPVNTAAWIPAQSLPIKLRVRRGNGNNTRNIWDYGNSFVHFKQKLEDSTTYPASVGTLDKLFDPEDPTAPATANNRQYPDVYEDDLMNTIKIDGWTDGQIYDYSAGNRGSPLSQSGYIDGHSVYPESIGLVAWKRIG